MCAVADAVDSALPYKKGIHKLIASWSSFIAHRTTDNAVSVSLATLGRFYRSDYLYHNHGRLSYRICTHSASRKTRPSNGLHNRQWCGIVVFNDCLQLKSYLCSIVSSGWHKKESLTNITRLLTFRVLSAIMFIQTWVVKHFNGYPIYPFWWPCWVLLSLNEDSSILLSVIMIPCFIGKCNSDCVSFLQPPIFAHISIFRCRGYVRIPNHAQKCSNPQIMAVRHK